MRRKRIDKRPHILSMSGGKDSTAMLHLLLKWKQPIDEIIFFDSGWEWPHVYKHLKQVERKTGKKVTHLKPELSFDEHLYERPIRKKGTDKIYRLGKGWPKNNYRWCTGVKIKTLHDYIKKKYQDQQIVEYLGFAEDERERRYRKNNNQLRFRYPLIELGYTEEDCLQMCYDLGYTWDGLYKHMPRLGCRCCPLMRIDTLRTVRREYPKVWNEMLEKEDYIPRALNLGFGGRQATVHDLEKRFAKEEAQFFDTKETIIA